jgi:hypothetical protein
MHKNVWPILAPDEAVPFRVIKPLDGSLHLFAPPDGDLDGSHGELNRDKCSRHVYKLRGVYQKHSLSQETIRLLRSKKARFFLLQKRFNTREDFFPRPA